jgi:hypothetical protein
MGTTLHERPQTIPDAKDIDRIQFLTSAGQRVSFRRGKLQDLTKISQKKLIHVCLNLGNEWRMAQTL